ncbi:MAG TPA: hypothetical protein VHN14_27305 [Kofleriaceae bacterium]|jgi:hypothetical protein|nr:hypothetical protein [Kofleriaceae bacterium]
MQTSSLLLLVVVGCASTPDAPHLDFASDTYTLQPGDEKYLCYTTNLPADRDIVITKISPTYGAGAHHILFSQAAAPEPAGVSECPVLSKTTWVPLYAGGKGSTPLVLPEQTGFQPLARGQQVVMQLHLQNATDAPITAHTSLRLDYLDATPDIIPAGIFGFDNRKLVIPPHTDGALNEMNCTVDKDLNVFAVLGHMHKHGLHLDLSRGATAGAEMLYAEDWNFDVQPVTPVAFKVNTNDHVFVRCTHNNDSDAPLTYGESSDTEMCVLILYYAPFQGRGACVNK